MCDLKKKIEKGKTHQTKEKVKKNHSDQNHRLFRAKNRPKTVQMAKRTIY